MNLLVYHCGIPLVSCSRSKSGFVLSFRASVSIETGCPNISTVMSNYMTKVGKPHRAIARLFRKRESKRTDHFLARRDLLQLYRIALIADDINLLASLPQSFHFEQKEKIHSIYQKKKGIALGVWRIRTWLHFFRGRHNQNFLGSSRNNFDWSRLCANIYDLTRRKTVDIVRSRAQQLPPSQSSCLFL